MIPITFNPQKILTYLQRHSPVNTFRLSRDLEINRDKLIDMIEDLTEKGLAKFEHGSVSIIEKNDITQKFAKVRKLHNKVRKEETNTKKNLAYKEKSFKFKKVRAKKKAKKVRTKRIRLSKEKQEALDWIRLANLDIEKLKIEIRLLSLSPNPEEIMKLRDSIAKLKEMIDQKIKPERFK